MHRTIIIVLGIYLLLAFGPGCQSDSHDATEHCGEIESLDVDAAKVFRFRPGSLAPHRSSLGRPALRLNEASTVETLLLVDQVAGEQVVYEGMILEDVPGIRVTPLDPTQPVVAATSGECIPNRASDIGADSLRFQLAYPDTIPSSDPDPDAEPYYCNSIVYSGDGGQSFSAVSLDDEKINVIQDATEGVYYCVNPPLLTPHFVSDSKDAARSVATAERDLLEEIFDFTTEPVDSGTLILGAILVTLLSVVVLLVIILVLLGVRVLFQGNGHAERDDARSRSLRHIGLIPYWYLGNFLGRIHDRVQLDFVRSWHRACIDKWQGPGKSRMVRELAKSESEPLAIVLGAALYEDRVILIEDVTLEQVRVLIPRDFRQSKLEPTTWKMPIVAIWVFGVLVAALLDTAFPLTANGNLPAIVFTITLVASVSAASSFPRELRLLTLMTEDGVIITIRMPVECWSIFRAWMNGSLGGPGAQGGHHPPRLEGMGWGDASENPTSIFDRLT